MVQKLVDILNLLEGVHVAGRQEMTRFVMALQKIEEVAQELKENERK